ncbi:MAG TPA: PLP-dependent aminotransferase family protein [Propionicimonas sp.]|nr:PLP-dependent aminotransferase family protein [Propionicimonas sp.]
MRTAPEITLALRLSGDGPLPAQLAYELRRLISDGVLAPGDALPSSRALAAHLGVSRGSVVAGYDQLLAEGYLAASTGRATIVNPALRQLRPRRDPVVPAASAVAEPTLNLRPGRPWAADVTGAAWRAAWRQASLASVDLPVPALGLPTLRTAWADHLRRMRGVLRGPSQIAVTGGGREGLALLLLALGGTRPLTVGVEEPGYPSLRRVPARFGATVLPLAADRHGLDVAALPTGKAAPDLLLVTPSHQYPLGGTLPVDRRQALLEWARQHRVVVVEDDYDSELRYTSQPLPALAALDDPADERVVLLGTLSKTLTPALATGFLALPGWLVPAVSAVRAELGSPVGLVPQLALATYLDSGALRLHTQRVRNRYRRRRAQVVAALAAVEGIRVYPMDGGLHAVVETVRPETEVVATLTAAGVQVSPLSQYWSGGGTRSGIVFGFGAVAEDELARGLKLIAAAAAAQH